MWDADREEKEKIRKIVTIKKNLLNHLISRVEELKIVCLSE